MEYGSHGMAWCEGSGGMGGRGVGGNNLKITKITGGAVRISCQTWG